MKDRKLAKQSPHRSSYMAKCTKTNNALAFESALERDYFHLLEFDQSVTFLKAQPGTTRFRVGEKTFKYTPDFYVVQDGVAFIDEVKPLRKTLDAEFQRRKRRLTKVFSDKGFHFRVITEEDIYSGQRHQNLRFLHAKLSAEPPLNEFTRLCQVLPKRVFTVAELQELLPAHGLSPCLVSRAVAHGLLRADLTDDWPSIEVSW